MYVAISVWLDPNAGAWALSSSAVFFNGGKCEVSPFHLVRERDGRTGSRKYCWGSAQAHYFSQKSHMYPGEEV